MNRALNSETYSSFERVSSNHKIASAKIRLNLQRDMKQTVDASRYDWFSLTNIILEIIYGLCETSLRQLRRDLKDIFGIVNLKTLLPLRWKQQLSSYQPNQEPNIEFHVSQL